MKDGLPPSYRVYRGLWSVLHVAVLLLVAVVIGSWWFTDTNGGDLVEGWWEWAGGVQQALFHWIPFPWDSL
jgi:hypothetical protein